MKEFIDFRDGMMCKFLLDLRLSVLQAPGSGYGTGNFTSWLEGGCQQ